MNSKDTTDRRKKHFRLEFAAILLAVVFLLVTVLLLTKYYFNEDNTSTAVTPTETVTEMSLSEYEWLQSSIRALELLTLAQDAYYTGNSVAFHGYMAELEGYQEALPENAAGVFQKLQNELNTSN